MVVGFSKYLNFHLQLVIHLCSARRVQMHHVFKNACQLKPLQHTTHNKVCAVAALVEATIPPHSASMKTTRTTFTQQGQRAENLIFMANGLVWVEVYV